MQAVINISSEGTRLRPVSCMRCTGMLSVGGENITKRLIKKLCECDVKNIIIVTGYMPKEVKDFFKDGGDLGVKIAYVDAMEGDGVLKVYSHMLEDEFLYFSKVIYTDEDFSAFIKFHLKRRGFVSIYSGKGKDEGFTKDKDGKVTRIEEKRLWNSVASEFGSGIFLLKKEVLRFFPKNTSVSIGENILPNLVRAGKDVYCYKGNNNIETIGDIASFMRANFAFLESGKKNADKGIIIEKGAIVEKGALIEGPCYIGKGSHIHSRAKVFSHSVIGEGCVVGEGASIKRCIAGNNCRIGALCEIRGCVLDDAVIVGKNTKIFEQGVIGFGTKLGDDCVVKSFVKIWPEKNIEKGSVVTENLMWGQKKREKIFCEGKIEGGVNLDITPSFCTRLGECIGQECDMGEVGIATDGSASSVMIRDGIVSGLLGMGIKVKDFGEQPMPVTRRGVAFYMMEMGININVSEQEGEERAEISLIDRDGLDISCERRERIEELFKHEAGMYPESKNIFECEYLFEYKLYYLKSLVGYEKRKCKKRKMLLSCKASWGRRLVASAMADFSASVSMYMPYAEGETKVAAFEEAQLLGGFNMGFILDDKCEKVVIVYDGKRISDEVYEALCALIVMKKHPKGTVYIPSTASNAIEKLGEKYGCSVIRTRSKKEEMMRHLTGSEEYLTDQFVMRFDAVGAIIKIVDFLSREGFELKELLDEMPPIAMAKTKIEIPQREIEAALEKICLLEGGERDNPEGVKITFDKGWVVIVPDEYRDMCAVVGEGVNYEFAKELCDFCISKMRS